MYCSPHWRFYSIRKWRELYVWFLNHCHYGKSGIQTRPWWLNGHPTQDEAAPKVCLAEPWQFRYCAPPRST